MELQLLSGHICTVLGICSMVVNIQVMLINVVYYGSRFVCYDSKYDLRSI